MTVLEGNVTARRGASPAAVPLKFKDDVFLQDTVATADKSLARILLGGKALVTVRERSVLTITEVPGRSTIELESGKFALALAREKMRPGEEIQIRTPNAVAGVRGTVVVTEVRRQGAQVGAGLPAVLTSFFVLRGALVAQPLDAARQPVGAPLQVGTLQSYTGAGLATPRVQPIPPEQIGAVIAGLQPTGPKRGSDTAQDDVKAQGVQTAIVLLAALSGDQASFLAGLPSGLRLPPTLLSTLGNVDTRVINPFFQLPEVSHVDQLSELSPVDSSVVTPAVASLCPGCLRLSHVTVNVTGAPFQAFSGSFASTSPEAFLGFDTSILTHSGSSSFVQVPGGSAVSFGGPLAALLDTSITTSGTFLEIENSQLTNTSTSPLVTLDPSSIDAGDALVALNGATLATGGPLLTDTGGTVGSHHEFLRMVDSTLTSTTTEALVTLTGTTLGAQTLFGMIGSTMALAGPDVDGTGSASLLAATDSHLDLAGDALFVANGSGLSSTSLAPLVSLTNTNVSALGTFLEVLASSVTLNGSLLRATNLSSIATGFPFIDIGPGGSLTTMGTVNPLVDLDTASLTAGGAFLQTNGTGTAATVNMSGPLLRSVASTLALTDISPTSLAVTNPPTGRANVTVGDGTGAPNGLAVTPDGTRVYVANGGRDFSDTTLTIVSTATNTVVGSIDLTSNDPPIGIAFNPTGTRGYATAAFSDVISVIDTDPASPTFNTILTNFTIPSASFARFAVVTGGRVYITDQSADKVHVITDSAAPVFVQSISVGVKPFGIAVSPDGSKVYVTNRGGSEDPGSVSVISTASNTVIATIGLGASTNPAGIVVTPNGAKVYVANTDASSVSVIDAVTNTVSKTIGLPSAGPRGIAVTPDGTRVLVATGTKDIALATLTVINTATDTVIATIALDNGSAPAFVAVSPDGRRVYVTEENALNLAVLDLETGTAFVAIGAGSSVTAAGSAPFIDMTGSTLTADHLLLLEGTLTLHQSLLRATNSTLTIPKALVRILPGGALITQPNAAGPYPLVLLSGGSLHVGTDALAGSIFDIAGRTVVSGLGTDQPIQHGGGGSLLELTNGASVEVEGPGSSVADTRNLGNVLTVDTALLNATAPILKMSGQSYLESYGNVIDLASRANLQTSLGTDLIRIDQSRLDIVKGHLVSVTGGVGASSLGVGGNLLTMVGTAASPSALNLFNGTLLFAKEGSQANIAGSLVQFVGSSAGSNVINVTNSFSPTSFINGVPVYSTFGTTVTITGTPLANLGTQGTITVNGANLPAGATGGVTGSLVVVQGSGTTVKIGP